MDPSDLIRRLSKTEIGLSSAHVEDLLQRWKEPHRHWHGLTHLEDLLTRSDKLDLSTEDRADLDLAIFFHDIVYDPRSTWNETNSAALLKSECSLPANRLDRIQQAIEETATGQATSPFSQLLQDLDRAILKEDDWSQILAYEKAVAAEYQHISWPRYRKGRIEFLESLPDEQTSSTFRHLLNYLRTHRPRIGLYAGSFNPFHKGHLNVLEKSGRIFDKVIIAVGINPEKTTGHPDQRRQAVADSLPFHEVISFSSLLTDCLDEVRTYADVTLVRGLRDGYDLQYELNQARFLEDISSEVEIIYFACDRKLEHISSSSIRGLDHFNPDQARTYLPEKYNYAKVSKT